VRAAVVRAGLRGTPGAAPSLFLVTTGAALGDNALKLVLTDGSPDGLAVVEASGVLHCAAFSCRPSWILRRSE
jgi:hypothetical protein